MSRAFSRGIYTTLSVTDAGDASQRRIWNLIGFQNVCVRSHCPIFMNFSSSNREETNEEKGKEANITKGESLSLPPSFSPIFSFPRKEKKRKNEEIAF